MLIQSCSSELDVEKTLWKTQIVEKEIQNTLISSVSRVKLLAVDIDCRLDFDYDKNKICTKASRKPHTLSGVYELIYQNKREMLIKTFIILLFS